MGKPLLIIVNGLPGTGKTTLAKRLAADVRLPVFHRDGIYETLYDALECHINGRPPLIGPAAFTLLHYFASSLLAAGQSLIVEGFFGLSEVGRAEFLQLQRAHDFEPFQIQCKTDGPVLLERFLERAGTRERHACHRDLEFVEQNKERILKGHHPHLALGGQVVEVDTTTYSFDYAGLLNCIHIALLDTLKS
ncbi:AAA family ATPase [Ktedonobacteria bacterium brp13]|nr:AAA family ATPase [Ktedonobacteria bacterium brp13]